MDITAADTLNNKEHGILTAGNDVTIHAGTINNNSATIEAGQNADITADTINNTNDHFSTERQVVSEEDNIVELQGEGSTIRYRVGDSRYRIDPYTRYPKSNRPTGLDVYIVTLEANEVRLHTPENAPDDDYKNWYIYTYNEITEQDVVKTTDPGKITAGRNMTLTGGTVTNDKSQIIAGGALTANVASLNNVEVPGNQYVIDSGSSIEYKKLKRPGPDTSTQTYSSYDPAPAQSTIQIQASTFQAHTAPGSSGITAGSGAVSSLFSVDGDSAAAYYVETDPQFTNKQKFLSSDYFFTQMGYDADHVAKRLGDGYYEQQLVSDEVMQLTGKRYTGSYTSNEQEYQALMNNAVAFSADNGGAKIGVALTEAQQAKLTQAIVWMVEESVVLPNGQVVTALVPQVYVPKITTNYGTMSAAVISANTINVKAANDILNQGTIAAGNAAELSASNINNNNGNIRGSDVLLNAQKDISNTDGTLQAANRIALTAGNNINVTTATDSTANAEGTRTSLSQVGTVSVTGDKGTLSMQAGHDVNLQAASVSASGDNSTVSIAAGHDVNLTTVQTKESDHLRFSSQDYKNESSQTDTGTEIQTNGSLNMSAGNNVNASAAYVETGKALAVSAGNTISIAAGHDTESIDDRLVSNGQTGGGNSEKTTIEDQIATDNAVSSTFSGDTVKLTSGKDINVTGSNIAGTGDVDLTAKGNVNIQSAAETDNEYHYYKDVQKGIFSSGIGFTVGTQSTKDTQQEQNTEQAGSMVGSTGGNVNIKAGDTANIAGSNVIAEKDINITAGQVNITNTDNTYNYTDDYEYKKTGLSVSLGGSAVQDLGKVTSPLERMNQVDSGTLKALYAIKAADEAKEVKTVANGIKSGSIKSNVSVDVSFGTSESKSHTASTTAEAAGSDISSADGNVNIIANKNDIDIKGSDVTGNDVNLNARDKISAAAAENSNDMTSASSSKSASIGASFGLSGSITPEISGSSSNDNVKENETTYTQSRVTARDTLTSNSGADTDIIGSAVSGNTVKMDAGGDLNIRSLQDTDNYSEQDKSTGFDISGTSSRNKSISASADKNTITSNYASTVSQAGIYAGSGGFDIHVNKNTDLKGAVIASDAEADKNSLSTDTLTYSDIRNKAGYEANSKGINYNSGASVSVKDRGLTPDIGVDTTGRSSGTTKSAIAAGTIDIRSNPNQNISGLSRDTQDALNQLGKIFDKDKVEEKQELASVFGQDIFDAIGDIKQLKDGSPEKIAVTAFAGGLVSKLSGGSFASGAAGAGINQLVINELAKIKDPAVMQWASAAVGAAAAKAIGGDMETGASMASSDTKNNYLNHYQEQAWQNQRNAVLSDISLTPEQKGKKLAEIDTIWQYIDNQHDTLADYNNCISDGGSAYSIPNDGSGSVVYGLEPLIVQGNRSNRFDWWGSAIINTDTAILDKPWAQAAKSANLSSTVKGVLKIGPTSLILMSAEDANDLGKCDTLSDYGVDCLYNVIPIATGFAGGVAGEAFLPGVGGLPGTIFGGVIGERLVFYLKTGQ